MAITTTSLMSPAIKQSWSQRLLAVEDPDLIHKTAALRDFLPRHGGDTLRRARYARLGLAVVPLGNDGLNPPPQVPSKIFIDATVQFYGTYMYVNEQVILQSQEKVLNELTIRLGVSMRQSQDQLVRDQLMAAAGAVDASGGLNGDDPTDFTFTDMSEVTRVLKGANAQSIMNMVEAADKYGTGPVRQSYFGMGHTDLISTLDNIPQFKHTSQYPSQQSILPAEWGSVGNVRFLLSSVGAIERGVSMLGRDVYDTFITGMEAYACVEQDGLSAQFIYLPPQFSGGLAQNVTIGYKFGEVAQILNDHWIIKERSTLPNI
jgi:N4-gp56 family major capsid protein